MSNAKNLFTIYPRKLKNGKTIFYYYIYDTDGKRCFYSTGEEKKEAAFEKCYKLLQKNQLFKNNSIELETYTVDWFHYDRCPYIQYKLLHGFSYSRSHASNQRNMLDNHIIPFFTGKKISEIKSEHIEIFIQHLKADKHLTNTTVNHLLSILSIIFSWALKHNDITNNPMSGTMKLKSDTKEKGILSDEEIETLLLAPAALKTIWNNDYSVWLLNLTAYKTGCRMGELQALQRKNVRDGLLIIENSWDRNHGLKGTKTGKTRYLPIDQHLTKLLQNILRKSFGDFVFGKDSGRRAIRHDEIYKSFFLAIEKIGLTKQDLKSRNITWHSYRHSFASKAIAKGIAPALVRAYTGHSTNNMLDHYTHIGAEDLRQIAGI